MLGVQPSFYRLSVPDENATIPDNAKGLDRLPNNNETSHLDISRWTDRIWLLRANGMWTYMIILLIDILLTDRFLSLIVSLNSQPVAWIETHQDDFTIQRQLTLPVRLTAKYAQVSSTRKCRARS
jgi:hypothetical protein